LRFSRCDYEDGVFRMLRHVALVRSDVSEERSASIIRATRIDELGTLAAACVGWYMG
jgi:hypothetical protein